MKSTAALAAAVGLAATTALAQAPPDYDFQWAVIGDPGNPAYDGGLHGQTAGRGSVDYTFRMSRLEVTTSQWMEYVNTFSQVPGGVSFSLPTYWGATFDPTYSGPGKRWKLKDVPHAEMLPVEGISWQEAARYTNWLHNGKQSDPASLETGAYDTSTWGIDPTTGHRTDGGRLPGAKFWIPSLDEWLKAAHYDPHKHGPGVGGWWLFPHGSDELIEPGPPGVGETSAGWEPVPSHLVWYEPLGAYEDTQSPWGLWDVSGGTSEWLEEWGVLSQPTQRALDGARAGTEGWFFMDRADVIAGGARPGSPIGGVRIATVVPTPPTGSIVAVLALGLVRRRR